MAWVILHAGRAARPTRRSEFCRGKIAHFKIPRYGKFATHSR